MSELQDLQTAIATRMRRGATFAEIEAEIIDPSGVSESAKAALWLYGWSFVHWRRQRREAIAHIEALDTSEPAHEVPRRHLHVVTPASAR
jgi:hypothetical protein